MKTKNMDLYNNMSATLVEQYLQNKMIYFVNTQRVGIILGYDDTRWGDDEEAMLEDFGNISIFFNEDEIEDYPLSVVLEHLTDFIKEEENLEIEIKKIKKEFKKYNK